METCRICLEEISPEDLYTTKCGHKFHKDCFEGLENINKKTCYLAYLVCQLHVKSI